MTEFPAIISVDSGYRVQTSKGAYLPGIYINHLMAEKALNRFVALAAIARKTPAKNRKKKAS